MATAIVPAKNTLTNSKVLGKKLSQHTKADCLSTKLHACLMCAEQVSACRSRGLIFQLNQSL